MGHALGILLTVLALAGPAYAQSNGDEFYSSGGQGASQGPSNGAGESCQQQLKAESDQELKANSAFNKTLIGCGSNTGCRNDAVGTHDARLDQLHAELSDIHTNCIIRQMRDSFNSSHPSPTPCELQIEAENEEEKRAQNEYDKARIHCWRDARCQKSKGNIFDARIEQLHAGISGCLIASENGGGGSAGPGDQFDTQPGSQAAGAGSTASTLGPATLSNPNLQPGLHKRRFRPSNPSANQQSPGPGGTGFAADQQGQTPPSSGPILNVPPITGNPPVAGNGNQGLGSESAGTLPPAAPSPEQPGGGMPPAPGPGGNPSDTYPKSTAPPGGASWPPQPVGLPPPGSSPFAPQPIQPPKEPAPSSVRLRGRASLPWAPPPDISPAPPDTGGAILKGGVDSSRKGGRSRRQRGLVAEGEVNGFPVAVKVDNNAEPAVLYIANLQPGKGSTSPWTQAAGRLIQKWTASAPGTFELVAVKNSEGWIQLDQPLNIPVNPGSLQKTLNRP